MAIEGGLSFRQMSDASLEVRLAGAWRLRGGLPSASLLQRELESAPQVKKVAFESRELSSWDSSVLAFLVEVSELCRKRGIAMDRASLPAGLRRLLDLAEAVPEKAGARKEAVATPFLERIGNTAIGASSSLTEMLAFLGDMTLTFIRLFRLNVRFRASDLFLLIQQAGAQALPIVTLDQLPGRRDPRLRRRGAARAVRRADLRRRSGRHRHGARDGRDDDRDHHGRPHRRRFRGAARHA